MIHGPPPANLQRLWKRVQSPRLGLPQRLDALGQLLRMLDRPPLGLMTVDGHSLESCEDITHCLQKIQQLIRHQLFPRLERYRLRIGSPQELAEEQVERLHHYFQAHLYPLLTPLAIDPAHPFPRVMPGQLYLLVTFQSLTPPLQTKERKNSWRPHNPLTNRSVFGDDIAHPSPVVRTSWIDPPVATPTSESLANGQLSRGRGMYGLVKIINHGPRLVAVKPKSPDLNGTETLLIWREEIIKQFISALFADMQVTGTYQFRIICSESSNSGAITTAAANATSRLPYAPLHAPLRTRQPRIARVDVEQTMPIHLVQWLIAHLSMSAEQVCYSPLPLAMADLCELCDYLVNPGRNK